MKEKVLFVFSVLSFVLMVFTAGLIMFNFGKLSSPVILHFDEFKGVDLFGESVNLWGIWLVGLIMVAINSFLGYTFFYRERVLTYLFLGSGFLISILILVVLGTIISVN